MENMEKLLNYSWYALFIAVNINLILAAIFQSRMKRRHNEEWKTIGSPAIFYNNSVNNNILGIKYLMSKRHLICNDPVIDWLVYVKRFILIISYFLFVAVLIIGVIIAVNTSQPH